MSLYYEFNLAMPVIKDRTFYAIILLQIFCCFVSCKIQHKALFTDVTSSSGIDFSNNIAETDELNVLNFEYMYNGGGVAVGDLNGDGLPDIYFTGNQVPNKLYLNKGDLKFEDVTDRAGVAGKEGWKTGVTMADVNGDGLLDIYVCYSGKGDVASRANQLFINKGVKDGFPVFEEEAAAYGLDAPGTNSTQAVFFDYDHDGDLDMFLLNHATMFYAPFFNTDKLRTKRHPYFSNRLYRNDGGHFTDVSEIAGIKGGGNNFGLGVCVSDVNNDGWPDIYTTNDFEEQDFLYLNNHDGTFKDITKRAIKHISKYAMGCDIADYNNDGFEDIMVLDMLPEDNRRQKLLRGPDEYDKYHLLVDSGYFHQNMRNTLQLNAGIDSAGEPFFSEIGQLAGVSNTDWSWSPLIADYDNDGYKDLFISNGYLRDYTNMDFLTFTVEEYRQKYGDKVLLSDLVKEMPQTKLPNYIFRNKGDLTFENVGKAWGITSPTVSNGAVYADLDNDGDLDLIINNLDSKATIYRNNSQEISGNHFLRVQLQDTGMNRFAIGAKVSIQTSSGKKQILEMEPTRGFQSSVDPILHFGLGGDTLVKQIIVQWPDGRYSSFKNIKANQLIKLSPYSPYINDKINVTTVSLFTDVTATSGLNFTQHENQYVDFKNEALLPYQISKEGPRLSKADVNGDGLEDVFIGAPKGQSAKLFLQTKQGTFIAAPSQPWKSDSLCEDIQSAFFDADGDGDMDLYVVSGGGETTSSPNQRQDRLYINDGKGNFSKAINALPQRAGNKSCVAIADYNRDGKPDIFIGGRSVPGKYGIAPESYLLKNESTKNKIQFVNSTATDAKGLQFAGMVTDACWIDINKDGWPDLIVVGDWMPVSIFINNKGKLENKTAEYNLTNTSGLWTRIIPTDIDGDGDTDFILGNLAPNTQFKASVKEPMTLCINDFLKTGSTQAILCYYIQGVSYPYPSHDELLTVLPVLKKKFLKYSTYANATLKDIFTPDELTGMKELKVTELKNCLLQNTGKAKFTLKELPQQAQFSAVFGADVEDINDDGKNDMILCGNFYPFQVQLGREDASYGSILLGNGKGNFHALPYKETGWLTPGDIRDMTTIKTKSGATLYILAKNNDAIQVIRNNATSLKAK